MKGYNTTQKLHQEQKVNVTVTSSNGAGFGSGYISYTKKTVRETTAKRHVKPLYTIIIYKYLYLYIFNVTNVTPLLALVIIGLVGLRYNVT